MPVVGIDDVATAICMRAWIPIKAIIPVARKQPKVSSIFNAMIMPLQITIKNNIITSRLPKKPNSSPIIENIKSL